MGNTYAMHIILRIDNNDKYEICPQKENEALLMYMYKIARIQKEDANVRNKRTLRGIKID